MNTKTEVLRELNKMYRDTVKPEYIPCPNCGLKVLGKIRLKKHLQQHKKLEELRGNEK